MEEVKVREVLPKGLTVGEGPHWEAKRFCLLFVDIMKAELHRLFTRTGRHQVLRVAPGETGQTVSFAIPVQDQADLYVIGHGRSISLIEWPETDPDLHTRQVKVILHTVEGQTPRNRFNDGKCDPLGRLWAGTMGEKSGAPGGMDRYLGHLYRVDSDLKLTTCLEKVTLSNGLGWSLDRLSFYYIDSQCYAVDEFEFEERKGDIGSKRTLLDFKKVGLLKEEPDGMCVDANGDVWVACWSGGKVIRIDPTSQTVTQEVKLPATNITSVCFGGDDLSTLFVTSASAGLSSEQLDKEPAGAIFAVTGLGVTGLLPAEFKITKEALERKLA